jgi:S1-C subfamily serine protease
VDGDDLAAALQVRQRREDGGAGLLVQRVASGSPAEQLGLRGGSLPARIYDDYLLLGGDVILAVDGIGLDESEAYERIRRRLIAVRAGNGGLSVTVLRAGETIELTAAFDRTASLDHSASAALHGRNCQDGNAQRS